MSSLPLGAGRAMVGDLKLWPENPRKISESAFRRLKRSMVDDPEMLEARPLICLPDGTVIAGNMRLRAAGELEWDDIAVFVVEADVKRAREIALRDNNQFGEWEESDLATMLAELKGAGSDLQTLGFDPNALDTLLASVSDEPADPDDVPELPVKAITKKGDLWKLGDHRLLCGDSRDAAAVGRLTGGEPVDLLMTSPPYNVDMDYESHNDKTVPWPEYAAWLDAALAPWLEALAPGRFVAWNIGVAKDVRFYRQLALLEDLGLTFYRQMIWKKVGVGIPNWHQTERDPRARRFTPNWLHEIVALYTKGKPELGAEVVIDEKAQHDIFEVASSTATRDVPNRPGPRKRNATLSRHANKIHNAVYPVRVPQIFANHLTAPGEIVADPFNGVGSTLLACEKLGRRGLGMEIDPLYVDVSIMRWENITGGKAKRARK